MNSKAGMSWDYFGLIFGVFPGMLCACVCVCISSFTINECPSLLLKNITYCCESMTPKGLPCNNFLQI